MIHYAHLLLHEADVASKRKSDPKKNALLISASPDIPLRSKQLDVNAGCSWSACLSNELVCLLQ